MIHFKFSLLDSKSHVHGNTPDAIFDGLYQREWLLDPWVQTILREVERAEFQGIDRLYSLDNPEVSYSVFDISQGVKYLIVANNSDEVSFNIDHFGENLYKYFSHFLQDCNIHLVGCLNPYRLAQLVCSEFYPVYLDDFDVMVSDQQQFTQYFLEWSKSCEKVPVTYKQLTNWNKPLDDKLHIAMNTHMYKGYHLYYTEFDLMYKMNFIQSNSSEGKTFLLKRLMSYKTLLIEADIDIGYEIFMLRDKSIFESYVNGYYSDRKCLVLVDMDSFNQSITAFDYLLDTPNNFIFLFVGHHLTSYIRVPLESVYSCKLDRELYRFIVKQSNFENKQKYFENT